jgi:glycosyltransferase involved in cell wall biosynthesis
LTKLKKVVVLGIRGIPAQHGGFETFAEYLCPFLIKKGWQVTVYCQEDGEGPIYTSEWEGVKRIHIPVKSAGPLGTIIFDFRSIVHSLRFNGVFLTLGYNTAIFNILHRIFGKTNVINMDGIEWKRQKWSGLGKAWFWLNERFGCWFGNHLIADHPRIKDHLATRVSANKITMIPYGGKEIIDGDKAILDKYNLEPNNYGILIARAEPENSILEAVEAFSQISRDGKLVVLGNYEPETNAYHKSVLDAASDDVVFPGAIYDIEKVGALRYYSRFYLHGHQVGGTNPSLVEALGAGNAVLAHDNPFNRWVAKDAALYFTDVETASKAIGVLMSDKDIVEHLEKNARSNLDENFQWDEILVQYENLLFKWLPSNRRM